MPMLFTMTAIGKEKIKPLSTSNRGNGMTTVKLFKP